MIDPQNIPSVQMALEHYYPGPSAWLEWLEAQHGLDLATLAALGAAGEGEDFPPPPAAGALPVDEIPDPLKE